MKKTLILFFGATMICNAQTLVEAPQAKKIPTKLEKFGDVRVDPYFWLKERTNPEVINYLNAENKYTEKTLAPAATLKKNLVQEMRSRIKEEDHSAPYKEGDYFYYVRMEQGKEY